MKRLLFAAVVGFLFSAPVSADADNPPATPTTVAPLVGSTVPTPMVTNTLMTQPRRMGFFARLRARNTNPMLTTNASYTTTPVMTGTTAPTTAPAPMPSTVKPSGTSNAVPAVTGAPVVSGTTPMSEPMMVPSTPSQRMGLLARLRMRRTN